MTTMLYDSVQVDGPRRTRDGYLVAEARVARTGIQTYLAGELGFEGDPTRAIRVYRPPEEVFSKDAMATYAHRPVTVDHPSELVTADNWREHVRGKTGEDVMRDGEFVRVPLTLMDAAAIKEWESGKRELSMGYTMTLDATPGTTEDGEEYDAVQRDLRMNHLALVARARGGSQLRLGDDSPEDCTVTMKTITVDGLSVETTEQGAQAIAKLQGEVNDSRKALETAQESHSTELAAKDRELAAKDAEIDSLKSQILAPEALDAAVRERSDLIARAKKVADQDYTGKTAGEIRKTALTAKLGATALDGKSDEYIEARFDLEVERATDSDPVRDTLRGQPAPAPVGDERQAAFNEMLNARADAWRGEVN